MPELKVKDIADELNTKSKRIIEKLDELKIIGKGPMSRLSEDEIQKLYAYIGFIRPKKDEQEEKPAPEPKKEPAPRPVAVSEKPSTQTHKGQYIIRRVENVVSSDERDQQKKDPKKRYIVSSDDSGLLQGYTTSKTKYKKPQFRKEKEPEKEPVKEQPKTVNPDIEPQAVPKKPEPVAKEPVAVKPAEKEEIKKEPVPEIIKKAPIEAPKEIIKEIPKEVKKEIPKEVPEEIQKEVPKKETVFVRPEIKEAAPKATPEKPVVQKTEPKKTEFKPRTESKPIKPKFEERKPERFTRDKKPITQPPAKKPDEFRLADERYEASDKTEKKEFVKKPFTPRKPVNTDERPRPFTRDKDDDKDAAQKAARPFKRPVKTDDSDTKTVIKPDKAVERRPSKKLEQQKQAKKENAPETVRTKKQTRTQEGLVDVDLKTTARLFSEEQVEKSGIADEKVLDFYQKASPKFKPRTRRGKNAKNIHREIQKPAIPTEIKIDETISVKDFAEIIKKTSGSIILKLMNLGVMATANEMIDFDTAAIIAEDFGIKTVLKDIKTEEDILFDDENDDVESLTTRPPIVVVMGHVDHGKTSLLDAIKNTNVIDQEAGGITQHIGAYMVNVHGRDITFLDTPGHEAFTSLRARGAQVTDIAIVVVAADDGIMPQTVEAINHAKSAGVNIIVAINKIDLPDANIERVKQELTEYGLVTEEWGGDTICVPVSAKDNENIEELLDMVILSADMLDLKSNPKSQAKGTVIDASLDKNKGVIATLIVQRGTLKTGDSVVTGTTVGRIRAMSDYRGKPLAQAGPSTPVEIFGLPEVPEAGELFYAIQDQKLARQLAEKRRTKQREESIKKQSVVTLEDLFSKIKEGDVKDLNLILKADVQGSIEALKQTLTRLGNDEVAVKIVHDAVGTITETDVSLAQVTGSIIIGFNVRPSAIVTETAEKNGVDMRLYSIIYEAIEDVENALKGMLAPKFKEETLGHAEIREIFKVSGVGTIAGCYVLDGRITRNSKVRIIRNGVVVHTGELGSLKRFKDDAREVAAGYECGTSIERYNDIKAGDVIEAYHTVEEVRT